MFYLALRQCNERHTAINLSQKLLQILDEFKIKEKTWIFVSNSAKNMEKREYLSLLFVSLLCILYKIILVGRILNNQDNLKDDKDIEEHLEDLDDQAIAAMFEELENFNEIEESQAAIVVLEEDLEQHKEMSKVLRIKRLPCSSHKVW